MGEFESTMTQKGQVTIPAELRTRLGLKAHDRVIFSLDGDVITLRPASSKIARGCGAVVSRRQPEDFREVRQDFEEGVAEEVIDSLRGAAGTLPRPLAWDKTREMAREDHLRDWRCVQDRST